MSQQATNNVATLTQKQQQDQENLFEAEVEYILDELQQKAHGIFQDEASTLSDCAVEIRTRLNGMLPHPRGRRYWLRDLGVIVLQIMTVMEAHGYKLSEEVLEVLVQAREDYQVVQDFARERQLAS